MKFFKFLVILKLSFVLFACTENKRSGIDPQPELKASPFISESFQTVSTSVVKSADLDVADKAHVVISKSALTKEFLLSTNLLSQTPTPSFSSLQSRVVSFILRDKKVYLLDVTKNNSVGSGNIPQNLLIAEFEVLKESSDQLEIDFNGGMKQIFSVGDMSSSDYDGFPGAQYNLPTTKVNISFLDEVSLKDGALFISQIAQMTVESDYGTESVPVEVRYQIKPYLPDPTFIPKKSPGYDKVAYFEANPLLLKDGSTRLYAMKWNEKSVKKIH
jgi:hypothetical protein